MIRKILFLFTSIQFLLAGGIHNASAIPAYPHRVTYTQSDGTRITIRIIGDEYHHYVLSEEGYTLVGGPSNDYYYARLADDGNLEATPVKAKPYGQLTTTEKSIVSTLAKGIQPTAASSIRKAVPVQTPKPMLLSSVGGLTPPARFTNSQTTGNLSALVILVEFSDIKFSIPSPQAAFNAMLNEDGYSFNGSTGSAWNYYQDNSDKKFNPQFHVVGPYAVARNAKFYASTDGMSNVPRLIADVCTQADADIDFSQYADDGVIRDIFVFYAGYNQAEGVLNTIWPHRYDVRNRFDRFFDGVQLAGYACSSEYKSASGKSMSNIGPFCHEFGHVLGWPDFYDTKSSYGRADGLENFSLMCLGCYNNDSRTPPALNILERWMAGWATPEELNETQTFELGPVCENKGLLIPTGTDNDYFLAEYRGTGKTVWDNAAYIGNVSGLMVYHVDYTEPYQIHWTLGRNTVNANPTHECMKLVRSNPGTSRDPENTIFPGKQNVVSLTPTTNRHYIGWSGSEPILRFTNIVMENETLKLSAERVGGPALSCGIQAYQHDALLRWNNVSANNWTVTWKEKQGSQSLGSEIVQIPAIHIGGLKPDTAYEVLITAKTDSGEEWSQTQTFVTEKTGNNVPHIGFFDAGSTKAGPILMTLLDYKETPKAIQWYIDGEKSSSNYCTFKQGEHCITAVITAANGSNEYLVKYITIE